MSELLTKEQPAVLHVLTPPASHMALIRQALGSGCDVICEKPVVLNPWNVEALKEMERDTGRKVFTILQLRLHPFFEHAATLGSK